MLKILRLNSKGHVKKSAGVSSFEKDYVRITGLRTLEYSVLCTEYRYLLCTVMCAVYLLCTVMCTVYLLCTVMCSVYLLCTSMYIL